MTTPPPVHARPIHAAQSGFPEAPALLVAAGMAVSALVGIVRSGLPAFAVPLAAPQFVTVLLVVTAGWVMGRDHARRWLPLAGVAVFVAYLLALLFTTGGPDGSYHWMMPTVGVVMLVVTVAYWLLGVLGTRRGPGWSTTAFVLLALAAPIWSAFLLLLAVLDTIAERALTPQQLVVQALTALLAVVGGGLAATRTRGSALVGTILLTLLTALVAVDLARGSDLETTGLRLLGCVGATLLGWLRVLNPQATQPRR